jgi:hypothetical protein
MFVEPPAGFEPATTGSPDFGTSPPYEAGALPLSYGGPGSLLYEEKLLFSFVDNEDYMRIWGSLNEEGSPSSYWRGR